MAKRVDLSQLTEQERDAFIAFYRDCRKASQHMTDMQNAAKTVFEEWMKSPLWHINEGEKPAGAEQDVWCVKPEINYVDRIEGWP